MAAKFGNANAITDAGVAALAGPRGRGRGPPQRRNQPEVDLCASADKNDVESASRRLREALAGGRRRAARRRCMPP